MVMRWRSSVGSVQRWRHLRRLDAWGEPKPISDWNAAIESMTWTPDSRELVYATGGRLWRIPVVCSYYLPSVTDMSIPQTNRREQLETSIRSTFSPSGSTLIRCANFLRTTF
jgi:hypothetical protein